MHSVIEIFKDEVYQFKADNAAPHIIDAGANIGLSVLFFKELYPEATIVAYEPDREIFQLLCENVGHLPGVELHEAAAWTEDTTLTFFKEGSLAGSTEMDFLSKGSTVLVRAERLKDAILKRPVDFLKIDIEGAENAVLFDIVDCLDHVRHLFFEYHSTPGKPQLLGQLLELVAAKGFRYAINGAHGPALPFVDKVPHGFDLQLNIFCFRE
ncbi:FkbM family methyltransferase [Sphingomonas bacterium]|uniref:FkbM family methyltransferase n=1 Tax=Sphingomonas bacterium TaxID=1895847 RepID=UPI001576D55B|nr:FkbM family methyltransferase [Sphingomonas bacterium]